MNYETPSSMSFVVIVGVYVLQMVAINIIIISIIMIQAFLWGVIS